MTEVSVPFINSLVVLDVDGTRLFAKYYDGRSKEEQSANEIVLQKKTRLISARSEGKPS